MIRISLYRVVVVLLLVAQLVLLAVPRFGHGAPGFDEAYRVEERVSAYHAGQQNPSAANQATWELELTHLQTHIRLRNLTVFGLVAVFDATLIYFLWNYGTKRTHG